MTIPAEPLRLSVDVGALTLDELEMFSEPTAFKVSAFKSFMAQHSNWGAAQVGAMTLDELRQIAPVIGAELARAVPKAK